MLEIFRRHLPTCSCADTKGGKANHHIYFEAKRFRQYLSGIGVCKAGNLQVPRFANLTSLAGSLQWMQRHRGAKPATLWLYCRDPTTMLALLGYDVGGWDPKRVRTFLLDSVCKCSVHTTEKRVTSAWAFLRFLRVHGLCRVGLDQAVPALAHWRPRNYAVRVEAVYSKRSGLNAQNITRGGRQDRPVRQSETRVRRVYEGLRRRMAGARPRSRYGAPFALRFSRRPRHHRRIAAGGFRTAPCQCDAPDQSDQQAMARRF